MKGKVVLITGASSGIGVGLAVHFASLGCRLSLTGRDAANLQDTRSRCLEVGADQVLTVTADLERDSDIRRILDETLAEFGRLDVLVNNAGLAFQGTVEDARMEEFDRTMRVNLRAPFLMTQLCVPHLVETKGNVVNVSSYLSTTPAHNFAAYCMSKAALDHMTRMAAKELGPRQVRVNSVNPGFVPSNLRIRTGITITEEDYNQWHALGRGGTAEEVAQAVGFLADNDKASFVTGELFYVDGGASLMGI